MALEPWHRSPEYQPLSALRQAAVGMDMIIALEGMGTSPGPQWHTFAVPHSGRQSFEKCFHAGTAKLPAQHCAPGLVDRMDLKNVFGEIKTYDSNRHLDGPRNVASQLRPTLRHSMPVAAVVHPITSRAEIVRLRGVPINRNAGDRHA